MKNLFFIILLLFALRVYSQKNNQISFSIGSALPLANFKESDINNLKSGYAKNGRHLKISYSKEINRQVALQFTLMGISNAMDNRPVLREFINDFPTTQFASIQSRSWNNTSILIGISKKIQLLNDRLSLEPKVHAGYSFTKRPGLFISNRSDDLVIPQRETKSEASSLGLLFGLSNNYSINEELSFFVAVEYFSASPKFNFLSYPSMDKNSSLPPKDISYTQDVRLIMINGGLSFFF